MLIFVVGLSHHTAPIAVRDAAAITKEQLPSALDWLRAYPELSESCIISTCNRTELYGVTPRDSAHKLNPYKLFKSLFPSLSVPVEEYLFYYVGSEAAAHLFRVAAGLDSMAVGEPQVFGQVKAAYTAASRSGNTALLLNRLFHKAFSAAKRIRTETKIGTGSISLAFAAVTLVQNAAGNIQPLNILVIGAGDTGTLTARHFRERGAHNMVVTNRTFERAQQLAADIAGTAVRFDEFDQFLPSADVIITCIDSPQYCITAEQVKYIMKHRIRRPLFLIDLGTPRDIDPAVRDIPFVSAYDIDSLQSIVAENVEKRKSEIAAAERIIDEEMIKFFKWYSAAGILPVIRQLKEHFETIRYESIKHYASRVSAEEFEKLNRLTKNTTDKILRTLIKRLKERSASPEGFEGADVLKTFFNAHNITDGEKQK